MPANKKKLMKFRLMTGVSQGADYSQEPDKNGKYPTKTFLAKGMDGYTSGADIVESPEDLVKLHGKQKFQKLGEETTDRSETLEDNMSRGNVNNPPDNSESEEPKTPTKPTVQDLENSSADQLREGAKREGIDLKGATTKAQMVKAIREHYGI